MCEYAHSMGNGPGDLEDYFHIIEDNDAMCGGFVWEWCDHAIYKGQGEDGRAVCFYGGNHGERGVPPRRKPLPGRLVYPDRTPHTSLLEYRNVCRPARTTAYSQETRPQYRLDWERFRFQIRLIASCSEYTFLTKGKRVDGTIYFCTSLGVKIGGGLGTAICGWLLEWSGYERLSAVQPESCLNMLRIPMAINLVITLLLTQLNVEGKNRRLKAGNAAARTR